MFRFGVRFGTSYYGGTSSTTTIVPHLVDVALGGHGYLIDWQAPDPLTYTAAETIREQADQSDSPGEQSLNREGWWRRSQSSWHVGAGQEFYDNKDSNPFRFDDSQGVDIWDKWKLALLRDTTEKTSSANTNLRLAVAGGRLYFTDGATLSFYTDIIAGSATTVTGTPATAPTSIVSDGFNIWTAHVAAGIYKTTRTTATTASHITGTISLLGYVRNRVLAADAGSIYDITVLAMGGTPGALPAALFTHANTDFQWVGFAEGSGNIYLAGFSGDKSLIYRTAVKEDGTALTIPIVAAELPDGEVVTSVQGYLGKFIAIGTTKGWRLAVVGSSGDLVIGARVDTPTSVLAFEGQEEFIWYGLGSFTATSTGLGRMSTATFSDLENLVPAYASDLMVTGSGNIQSIVTFQDIRVFTVSGDGLYHESTTDYVPSGSVDSGKITFGLTEPKIGLWLDHTHQVHEGTLEIFVAVDGGAFVSIGTHEGHILPLPTFALGEVSAQTFEIRIVVSRAVDPTMAPELLSWLLRVQPQPEVTRMIYATVLIAPEITSLDGLPLTYDTAAERRFLESSHASKNVVTWQQGDTSESVILENYKWDPDRLNYYPDGPRGDNVSCVLKLKVVSS